MEKLLEEIATFRERHGLSEWQFGELALNDRHFIRQVRGEDGKRPRRVWPETEKRVTDFMAEYEARQQAAA
jgi:hypothetical protein